MGEKKSVSERTLLALAIIKRLPVMGYKTAKEIHLELENEGWIRTYRNIQKLLGDLEHSKIIHCDSSAKPFRYKKLSNLQGFSLAELSNHESLMLRLAEQYLKDLVPPKLSKSMKSLFDKSRTRLDDRTEKSTKLEKQWLKKVKILNESPDLLPLDIDLEILEKVSDALYENLELKVFYETRDGKQSEKTIRPLGLVQQGLRLYIAVNQRDRTGYYPMAIHRIKTAKVSTIGFKLPNDFDLDEFVKNEQFNFGDGSTVSVDFVLKDDEAAIHLKETPLSEDQTITKLDDGSNLFNATVVDSRLIDKYIFGFGAKLISYKKTKPDGSSEEWKGPTLQTTKK